MLRKVKKIKNNWSWLIYLIGFEADCDEDEQIKISLIYVKILIFQSHTKNYVKIFLTPKE